MRTGAAYEALTVETLSDRLAGIAVLAAKVGPEASAWQVEEVGAANAQVKDVDLLHDGVVEGVEEPGGVRDLKQKTGERKD